MPAWKKELNDKIAAARARKHTAQSEVPARLPADSNSRASRVAAAVAARYADAPSYSEYLAAQVRAAMTAAVAAQAAANAARAAAEAMGGAAAEAIAHAATTEPAAVEIKALPMPVATGPARAIAAKASKPAEVLPQPRVDDAASGFQYPAQHAAPESLPRSTMGQQPYRPAMPDLSDPVADALIAPATPLPAKLLEFPRELIAARKARPRHAEGPLRDGISDEPGQLRIFEVDPASISTKAEPPPQVTEWSSIRLDAYPSSFQDGFELSTAVTSDRVSAAYNRSVAPAQSYPASRRQSRYPRQYQRPASAPDMLPDVAGLLDRLMAGIVDAALVGIAFALFVFVLAATTGLALTGKPALIGGAFALTAFYLIYQLLFFSYADGTPGMRYARIALCTFEEENPTRQAMRKRIFALGLAVAPLGLGLLYAFFDEDGLAWHDRMTSMYQRTYK